MDTLDIEPVHHLLLSHLGEKSFTVPVDVALHGAFPVCDPGLDGSERIATLVLARGGHTLRAEGGRLLKEDGKAASRELPLSELSHPRTLALEDKGVPAGSLLFVRPSTESFRTFRRLGFPEDVRLSLGSDQACALSYRGAHVAVCEAHLSLSRNTWSLDVGEGSTYLYLNGRRLSPKSTYGLAPGDTLTLFDLTFSVYPRFISLNAPASLTLNLPEGAVPLTREALASRTAGPIPAQDVPIEPSFSPSPRLMGTVRPLAFTVEGPPPKKEPDETPLIMRAGPSALMGVSSLFMGMNALSRLTEGAPILSTAPAIAMALSMFLGMVLWPVASRHYERRRAGQAERLRRRAYEDYLAHLEWELGQGRQRQRDVLEKNRISPYACLELAYSASPQLFERTLEDEDALAFRIGTGDVPLAADIAWPSRSFSLVQDPLTEAALEMAERPQMVEGVPVALDLKGARVVGIAGEKGLRDALVRSLIVQATTLYSPRVLKLACFLDPEDDRGLGDALRRLEATLGEDGRCRMVASCAADARDLGGHLSRALAVHAEKGQGGVHYLVFACNRRLAAATDLISHLEKGGTDTATLVYTADTVEGLPASATRVVELGATSSRTFLAFDTAQSEHPFAQDACPDMHDLFDLAKALSHVRLVHQGPSFTLPSSLGFIECLGASSVDALGIERRWGEADATRSLAATVGLTSEGTPLVLDAHEAADGPHGLVAGTTGSGKSELIITWILSLCVSYPPDQVSFVLIDYKGGGLAAAFSREGLVLPHLAGTVTNLDGSEIARSLASLKAELTRRQRMLDEAKRETGDATMDITSYLRHYRTGDVTEPMPHLFIVADEFAELKQQEPDFMEGLISAARIGRSLGVHLVLATQKPAGVVSDQISANSRFRVCLRVADAADSKEMVRRADAARLEGPGRLLLLVGYDERYVLGQAAYAGGSYAPGASLRTKASVELLTPTGRVLDRLRLEGASEVPHTSELDACLAEVIRVAAGSACRRLWLDPLEAHPTLDGLSLRYPDAHGQDTPWEINPLIGEIDDPEHQRKHALTLPLSRVGNAVIYGSVGSGIEELVGSALYDLLKHHDPHNLNVYILDFASELLCSFGAHSCVGDVATIDDVEKVGRLFDFLEKEIRSRRKMLSTARKNFHAYEASEESPFASILLVVNGMGAFTELFGEYEPRLVRVLRDGARVGISTLVTATAPSEIRLRIRQGFKQYLACELSNKDDYLQVFSNMRGMVPPLGFARGIIERENKKYLFQGAFIEGVDEDRQELVDKLIETGSHEVSASPIALMPEHIVSPDLHALQKPRSLAIGLYENNLEPVYLSCGTSPLGRAHYALPEVGRMFVRSLCLLMQEEGIPCRLADMDGLLDDEKCPGICRTHRLEDVFGWLKQDMAADFDLIIITGIKEGLSSLEPQRAIELKNALSALSRKGNRFVLLVDGAMSSSYTHEGWYLSHAGQGDGIWIGPGADAQTAMRVSYGSGDKMEGDIEGDQGYVLISGRARFAQFIHMRYEVSESKGR